MPMSPRLLRPRASATVAFSPASISGLQVWLDPSVSSSLTIQTGVSEWRNLAPLGGNVAQSIANNQPTLTNAGSQPALINGRQALFFDGTNDRLDAPASNPILACVSGVSGLSVYAVVRPATTGYRDILSIRGNPGGFVDVAHDTRLWLAMFRSDGTYLVRTATTTTFSTNSTRVVGCRHNALAPDNTGDVNKTTALARATVSGSAAAWAQANAQAFVVGFLYSNASFSGLMGEILLYSRDLPTAEHNTVMDYLIAKWGA